MDHILTVSDYLDLVNNTLATIPSERIAIVGEIVDYRVSQGKWINFDLKDEEKEAKISCFATIYNIRTPLDSGLKVQVVGHPKVYERFGKFSLTVDSIELVGEGALARAYQLLKKKLEDEGLFAEERKRDIPHFPKKIGLITSAEAAAYGDFLRILNNRWGGVEVVHIPVHVQGKNAVPEIVHAFEQFNGMDEEERPDVIVLTRGGGSLEDLHAFNDESTARAVYMSKVPVVCGVGHERDESLCDFVADVRASTPSNAAERVVPDRADVLRSIEMHAQRMEDILQMQIDRLSRNVEQSIFTLTSFLQQKVQGVKILQERFQYAFDRFRLSLVATFQETERRSLFISQSFENHVRQVRTEMHGLIRVFSSYDVQKALDRGFAIVRSKKKVVKDIGAVHDGEVIEVQLANGAVDATVGVQKQKTLGI